MPTLPHYWKLATPQSNILPVGTGGDVGFHPTDNVIAVSTGTSPRIFAYRWNARDGFGTAPTGTGYTQPTTVPAGVGNGLHWHPSGSYIAVAHTTTPFITAYPWSSLGGFGAKFANPTTLPGGTGQSTRWHPSGSYLAVVNIATPFVAVYPWGPAGFGAKFPNPSTLPGATSSNGVAWHPTGSYLAIGSSASPFIAVYPWSPAGFGAKFPNPTTLPPSTVNEVAWHPSGSVVAGGFTSSPFIYAYPWSPSGFGVRYPNPTTTLNNIISLDFTPAGDSIVLSVSVTGTALCMYKWNQGTSLGFGPNVEATYNMPPNAGLGLQIKDNSVLGIAHAGSSANPAFFIYSKINVGNRSILRGGKL